MPSKSEAVTGSALIMQVLDDDGPKLVGDVAGSAAGGSENPSSSRLFASEVEMPLTNE
jgi:hypothetical protein